MLFGQVPGLYENHRFHFNKGRVLAHFTPIYRTDLDFKAAFGKNYRSKLHINLSELF